MITFIVIVAGIIIIRGFYEVGDYFYFLWKYEPIRYNAEDAKHQPRSYRR